VARRRTPRLLVLAAAGCAALSAGCAPIRVRGVPDPAGARRFEILDVRDSTFRFVLGGTRWVRAGADGITVDPQRRDALVARFVVQGRVADTATAVITGQTTRVTSTHVALLDAPPPRVARKELFWLGALAGGVVGVAAGLSVR
jgi:hypothetical protein